MVVVKEKRKRVKRGIANLLRSITYSTDIEDVCMSNLLLLLYLSPSKCVKQSLKIIILVYIF